MSIMVIAAVRDNRIEAIEACLYDDTSDIGREEVTNSAQIPMETYSNV